MGATGRFFSLIPQNVSYDTPPNLAALQKPGDATPENSNKSLQQDVILDVHGRGKFGIVQDAGDGNLTTLVREKDGTYRTTEEEANLPASKRHQKNSDLASNKPRSVAPKFVM